MCHATRARESAQARFAELHKDRPWHDGTFTRWDEKQTRATPYHHSHGTSIWVSDTDYDLGGDFLRSGLNTVDDVEAEQA